MPDDPHQRALTPVLEAHLGVDPHTLPVVTERLSPLRFADADIAMEMLARRHGGRRLVGIGGGDHRRHLSFAEILQHAGSPRHFPVAPVDYTRTPIGPAASRQVVSFGLHLLRYNDTPVVVLQRTGQPQLGRDEPTLGVVAPDEEVVPALLDDLRQLMIEHSVLRGQVVSFTTSDFGPSNAGVTFLPRPQLAREDVILPDGVLDRVERHLDGVARHRRVLTAAGQHLKRGLLLFGPPGTGKTHTVRYLMANGPETTVIVLSGRSLQLVSVAAQTARALEPAVVVLEDCDLIAGDRNYSPGPQPLLFEVLDVLDGLADDADVAFVLTTNRADLLEPALAQRPGRINLAVEIPLPDVDARFGLHQLYGRGLPFTPAALRSAAVRTEGTTASFAKELMRRAVLIAAEDGRRTGDDDLNTALDELLDDAETLSRGLLGTTNERSAATGASRAGMPRPRPGLAPR